MTPRLDGIARATLIVTCLAVAPGIAQEASKPAIVRFAKDVPVSVKGTFGDDGAFVARSVTATDDSTPSVRGRLDAVDVEAKRLRIGPLEYSLEEKSDVVDETGADLPLADLAVGRVVKISFEIVDGSLVVDKVRRRVEEGEYLRIEGLVQDVLPRAGGFRFRVAGVFVVAPAETRWEGIVAPVRSAAIDDENSRPADAIRLGRLGWLSGEIRLDASSEKDFDGADLDAPPIYRDGLERGRLRGEIEWTLPSSKHLSGFIELKMTRDEIFLDESDPPRTSKSDVRSGEAYLLASGVVGPAGSIQIGRSRWVDEREWWFREDLDSVRLFFERPHWSVDVSMAHQHGEMARILQDARYWMARATFRPGHDHVLTLWHVRRDDWFLETSGNERDFEPRHLGLHAEGGFAKICSYWADVAIARGRDGGDRLNGNAVDLGVMATLRARGKPTFIASYAEGSPDFRQTGIQNNNGKWNGVTNFHYYGEVADPELANLVVKTLGFGVRPAREFSIDVAWHAYALEDRSQDIVDANVLDGRRMSLLSDDLGEEWDVIFGYEGLERWEFELDVGRFKPGDAVLGPKDAATLMALKVKWVF